LLRFQQRAKLAVIRDEQIAHLKQRLISRYVSSPRQSDPKSNHRSPYQYPPHVAKAVDIVARTLNAAAPDDANINEFMTRTKITYLTALEILNEDNFKIDLPPMKSDDGDELSMFSVSVDMEGESQSTTHASNARNLLNYPGLSNKSVGSVTFSISSKDLGSKNPSITSLKCPDEDIENRIALSANQTPKTSDSSDESNGFEMMSSRKTPSPRVSLTRNGNTNIVITPTTTKVEKIERSESIDEERSLSDVEAEFGDEFDENGVSLPFNEPFDPKVNKADLKHSIATDFAEIEG
jgi:hypothetical protein